MSEWIVENRITGEQVYFYSADNATDFPEYPFAQYNHILKKPDEAPASVREISGVSYLRRFTQDERIAIRTAASGNAVLDDYLKLLDITIAQGGFVNLDDQDTIAAVGMLEAVGLLNPGRAAEVLA